MLYFTDPAYLDLTSFHPNICKDKIKSKKAALRYITKEDPNPLEYNMDVAQELKAMEAKRRILAKDLLDGKPLVEAIQEAPELVFNCISIEANLKHYHNMLAQ